MYRSIALFVPVWLTIMTAQSHAQDPPTMAGRSTVYAPSGVVATSQPLASAAGLSILHRGGNAIDAAVAAAAVLNLVEPHMTGIGGDMFAMLWIDSAKKLVGLNASGRSGSLMTAEELRRRGHERVPSLGAEAVTVPGALSGWSALLERYGTISLAEALQPAIELAEEGFPVSPIIAEQWGAEVERLKADKGASATYLIDGERAPVAGEWFRNPDLAASYRMIAEQGIEVMYGGELGRRIAERTQELGGFLTVEDFRNHRPQWVEPMSADYHGYRLWELPPNGQGVAALEMLRLLEPYDLASLGHNSPSYLHHLIEAKKIAYADLRRFVGDPDAMQTPAESLLTDDFIASRRALFDPNRALDRPEPGAAFTSSETIYLSAADGEGNMVSFINSLYSAFGSRVVVPGTGFALQNRGAGFTLQPDVANTVAPRKRPFHTIIPAFVTRYDENGESPWLSFGVMGGSMQPQGHVQVLFNLVLFGMDLQEAIDAPRFRHMSGLRVALEPMPDATFDGLRSLGHDVFAGTGVSFGGAQAVLRLMKGWAAGSDPRKDGMAVGY